VIDISPFRIEPGTTVNLTDHDPDSTHDFDGKKKDGKGALPDLTRRLADLQRRLWAESAQSLLVVLQAMDTGGKDGTIRHVFRGVNPQGVDVHGFGVPTEEELAHDYLWRVHNHTPADGRISIFNRSHYEDVLVVRVKGLVPEEQWSKRYEHIRGFEKTLADEGTTIVKLFLNISKDEQRERFQARLDEPDKNWKFRRGDLEDRELWDEYQAAYEEALTRTSTEHAPWHVVPANRKWYRNLAVSSILIETLQRMDPQYPDAEPGLDEVMIS
jgi:PPK2 family polyphosphate:nucleotide phosphotransferase